MPLASMKCSVSEELFVIHTISLKGYSSNKNCYKEVWYSPEKDILNLEKRKMRVIFPWKKGDIAILSYIFNSYKELLLVQHQASLSIKNVL